MSGSHEKLPMIFWVQIALVLIVGTIYLITPAAPKHHGAEAAEHKVSVETQTALKPVGEVAIKEDVSASGGASRSGETIVKKTCAACHIAGVANAPKLEASAKEAWTTRMAAEKGIDGLVASAKKGKNGMPPNGADPSLSVADLKLAIIYMLGQAGVEVATADNNANAPAPVAESNVEDVNQPTVDVKKATEVAKEKSEVPPVLTTATTKKEEKVAPTIPAEPTAPKAEVAPAAPKAAVMVTTEIPTAPAAPAPKVENPVIEKEVNIEASKSAVVAEVPAGKKPEAQIVEVKKEESKSEEAVITATPAATTVTVQKVEESKPPKEVAQVPVVTENVATIDLAIGEKVYKSICFSCHDLAIANAPKPGDKAAWAARIAKGIEALYNTALKGDSKMPAMPAKGGNPTLSDSDVKNAVSYMVELSK